MPDRVSLPPIPGLLGNYVDVDLFAGYFAAQQTLTEFQPAVTEAPTGGPVTVDLRTATGGGGDGLSATIPDGAKVPASPVTGSIDVPAGTAMYLRITATTQYAANFYGYYYVDAAAGVETALTTLERVKLYKGIDTTTNDVLLNQIIQSVSALMQTEMRRTIVTVVATAEKHDAEGDDDTIVLDGYPIITPPAVVLRYNGTVVDASTYDVDAGPGHLIQVEDGAASDWAAGRRAYEADYWHGYPVIPEDLEQLATKLVVFEFDQTAQGHGRLGLRGEILDPGGSAEYLMSVPGAFHLLQYYRNLRMVF